MSGNSPAHICILHLNPSLQTCNLNIAPVDFLFGMLDLEIFFGCLSICKDHPFLGEYIIIRMLKDLELREVAIFDNFCVHKRRVRWVLKQRQSIIALNRIANRTVAVSECLRNYYTPASMLYSNSIIQISC